MDHLQITDTEEVDQLLAKAESTDIVHKTMRQFGNKVQEFFSLTFEIISVECLDWVLKSLQKDEMTPNEKAI